MKIARWCVPLLAAAFAALVFGLHPLTTEAVANVVGRADLLAASFALGALLLHTREPSRHIRVESARAAAIAALAGLALLSKESAVILLPLFCIVDPTRWKRLAPHAMLTLLAFASIVQSRTNSFRFNDGSFSLSAPFWLTWPRSFARLLWIWGWLAAIAVLVYLAYALA